MLDDEEEEEERSGCLLLASDVSAPGAEAPPLGFLLKKWFSCAVRARETSAREENASAADMPPHANPHAKPRHTGKPYVLERAWVGVGGVNSARELGSNVDRLGAIAYSVDAAGAALADARFVEQRL
jgi:hypothetical protein